MEQTESVNIKVHRPSLVQLTVGPRRNVRLLPGENDVSAEVWDAVKDTAAIRMYLDNGVLEVIEGKASPHPTEATVPERNRAQGRRADDLSDFDLDQIERIVVDTDDLALLAAWGDDPRQAVQALVRTRMKAVQDKKKAKGKGGG